MPTKVEKDALTGTDTTGHEWDGIKELNNPLPRWWLYILYATIVYAVIWMVLYPSIPWINSYFGGILGFQQREILDNQVADARQAQADYLDAISESHLTALAEDPELFQFMPRRRPGRLQHQLRTVPRARRGRARPTTPCWLTMSGFGAARWTIFGKRSRPVSVGRITPIRAIR